MAKAVFIQDNVLSNSYRVIPFGATHEKGGLSEAAIAAYREAAERLDDDSLISGFVFILPPAAVPAEEIEAAVASIFRPLQTEWRKIEATVVRDDEHTKVLVDSIILDEDDEEDEE